MSSKKIDKQKVRQILTEEADSLDSKQKEIFDNMMNDFMTHLKDRRADMDQMFKRSEANIRKRFHTILTQIPKSIQDMTLEELLTNGATIDLRDGLNIKIPKTAVNMSDNLEQMISEMKRIESFKVPELKATTAPKKGSTKKSAQKLPRMTTRSTSKLNKEPISRLMDGSPDIVKCALESVGRPDVRNVSIEEEKMEQLKRSLSQLSIKQPREPKPDEEVIGPITFFCSSAGTPLIVEPKVIARISGNKS